MSFEKLAYRGLVMTEGAAITATVAGAAATVYYGLKDRDSTALVTGLMSFSTAVNSITAEMLRREWRASNPDLVRTRRR